MFFSFAVIRDRESQDAAIAALIFAIVLITTVKIRGRTVDKENG